MLTHHVAWKLLASPRDTLSTLSLETSPCTWTPRAEFWGVVLTKSCFSTHRLRILTSVLTGFKTVLSFRIRVGEIG